MNVFAFDVGGTSIRFSLLKEDSVHRPTLFRVPRTYASFLNLVQAEFGRYSYERPAMVVGGIAGCFNAEKGILVQSTHLPFLVGKNLKKDIEKKLKSRVVLENDNALVGLGETMYGAGRGYPIVAYIGIGTGIGGSRFIDGKLDRNAFGFEPGHHFLDISRKKHTHVSPHPGDWESLVSGSAVEATHKKSAEKLHDQRVWKKLADFVAYGLVNVSVFWSPNICVLGGSLMKRLSIADIRRAYLRRMKVVKNTPHIVRGALGDFGGLYGALALSKQKGLGQRRKNA